MVHNLDIDQIHEALVEMLRGFDAFCRARDLEYSLSSGTLLGAYRDQHIIPWDDDLDVSMSRPDYDRLATLADELERETGFVLQGYDGLDLSCAPFAKICRRDVLVKRLRGHGPGMLWMDVFPADGLPADEAELAAHYEAIARLQKTLAALSPTLHVGKTRRKRLVKALATPLTFSRGLRRRVGRKLDALARSIPYGSTAYVGHASWGLGGPVERLPYEGYARKVELEFEGGRYLAMSCCEQYLTQLYSPTFMFPPDPELRHSHHIEAWRLDDRGGRR